MKLIIDIDDEQVLFDIKNRGLESETETDKVIINALYDGIPLDDVWAEIKAKYDSIPWRNKEYDDGWIKALEWVLDILNRIGKQKVRKYERTYTLAKT